jgi:hypothetical protein
VDKIELLCYLEAIDALLGSPASLCVYGSAAFILLDEPARTSLDIDVAGPYSRADMAELRRVAASVGLPINPDESYPKNHIEWISAVRLALRAPDPGSEVLLWRGRLLTITTVPFPDLIASKLIRYDPLDQADIQYLVAQRSIEHGLVEEAVRRLPPPFSTDTLVLDNLLALKEDMALWMETS